ncbi:MAG: transposase [Burkholderiaceae bacterium]
MASKASTRASVVTNLDELRRRTLRRDLPRARRGRELIKEAQPDLFGTRASCHRFNANQMRLLLAGLAYTLMTRLWAIALHGTELAPCSARDDPRAPAQDRRAGLRNTRRIRLALASHHRGRATSTCWPRIGWRPAP